jgi:D-glycero-D-manno-heptose 1,7-bisphosphate phosphatase
MTQRRFVLLDRDGTLIVERNYLSDPRDVELLHGTTKGLRQLSELGLGLLLITNQSGVGRGYFDESRLDLVHQQLVTLLASEGVRLDGIYYCPHTPEEGCGCRKPNPGLVAIASSEHGFDPRSSFVVGDNSCDIELGRNVGATTILVRTGYGGSIGVERASKPDFVAKDMWRAAQLIKQLLKEERSTADAPVC